MHIPDGFLSVPVWITLDAVSIPAVGLLANRAKTEIEETSIPLLGVMGAFVFAAQMINFPVGLGTSGHLVGGALLACALGPGAAALVMTAILAIQALVFQDGGVVALGVNVMNMAIAGVLAGYLPYHLLAKTRWRNVGIFAGGFLSLIITSVLAISELLLSGVKMPPAILSASAALFFISAILEGLITVTVVRGIERMRPAGLRAPVPLGSTVFVLLAGCAVLLGALGFLFGSQAPDGIERIVLQSGINAHAPAALSAPLDGYEWRGIASPWLRRPLAGLAGVLSIWIACLALGRMFARRPLRGSA